MLICLPFFAGDKDQAIRLANWIRELGGVSTHDCLLVHDAGTTPAGVIEPLQEAFNNVTTLKVCGAPKADWSAGTGDARAVNEMWIQTATWIDAKLKVPWLWLEPDAAPTRSTFADEADAEYAKAAQDKKAFVGARVFPPDGPERMSGIAIYPSNVCRYSTKALLANRIPWDIVGAEDFRKHVRYTSLIYHFLRSSREAPTFPDIASLNAFPKEAAIFHPCKDSSLTDRLRERKNGSVETTMAKETASVSTQEYINRLANSLVDTSLPQSLELVASAPAQSGDMGLGIVPSLTPPTPTSFSVSDYVCALSALCTSPLAKARIVKALAAAGFVAVNQKRRDKRMKAKRRG